MIKTIATATISLLLISLPLAAQQGFSTIEERMTGKEFTAAGLGKLSPEELNALNEWLRERSVATLDAPNQEYSDGRGFETQQMKDFDDADVVSTVKGEFSGWTGETVFELENGMVWKQVEPGTFYIPPSAGMTVVIEKGLFSSWRLKAEGYNKTVRVERVE